MATDGQLYTGVGPTPSDRSTVALLTGTAAPSTHLVRAYKAIPDLSTWRAALAAASLGRSVCVASATTLASYLRPICPAEVVWFMIR